MPRPSRCRRICGLPEYDRFAPDGAVPTGEVLLTLDEFEVLRLIDHEKQTHAQCAARMDISRTTVTEIYETARFKVSDALVLGKRIRIAGGNYRLCRGDGAAVCPRSCPMQTQPTTPIWKGEQIMRIAVTYENEQVFPHFGHTACFAIYDVQAGAVQNKQLLMTEGSGHGALAGMLQQNAVDVLICGGIGGGARAALQQAGIMLYPGVSGRADDAVQALLAQALQFDPDFVCNHHGHDHHHGEGHTCGDHTCADHTCGDHTCHAE